MVRAGVKGCRVTAPATVTEPLPPENVTVSAVTVIAPCTVRLLLTVKAPVPARKSAALVTGPAPVNTVRSPVWSLRPKTKRLAPAAIALRSALSKLSSPAAGAGLFKLIAVSGAMP